MQTAAACTLWCSTGEVAQQSGIQPTLESATRVLQIPLSLSECNC